MSPNALVTRKTRTLAFTAAIATATTAIVLPLTTGVAAASPLLTQTVTFEVSGAQGGGGGGLGGVITATETLNVGTSVSLFVGGSDGTNGGGLPGTGYGTTYPGGGATDVRIGGTSLADRVVVAGGGGGKGGSYYSNLAQGGGYGGGNGNGSNGGRYNSYFPGGGAGGGASQSAGGGAGVGAPNTCGGGHGGSNGVFGIGGTGGNSGGSPSGGGGGGGGGYYGGGGGGGGDGNCTNPGGGGGGGSGYVSSALTLNSDSANAHGGGGSVRISLDGGLTWAASFSSSSTYVVPGHPDPTSLTPTRAAADAGGSVVVSGTNLDSVDGVTVGGAPANFSYASGALTVTWPSAIAFGADTVHVHSTTNGPATQDLSVFGFRTPVVTSISPSYVNVAGGTTVTIAGSELLGYTVQVGGILVPATVTDSQISFAAPAHAVGSAVVTVSNGDASTTTSLMYDTAPVISGLSPSSGPTSGTNYVIISASHFSANPVVTIDGTQAPITFVTSNSITVTTPAHAAGATTLTLTTDTGSTSATYTYVASPQGVLDDPNGPVTVGPATTISGSDLTGGTQALVDGVSIPFVVNSDSLVTLTMPAHAAGSVPVTYATAGGTLSFTYSYWDAPTITDATPSAGPTAGGSVVTLTGTNLDVPGSTAVSVGGVVAVITASTPTSMTFTVPAGSAGQAPIVVLTAGGTATSSFTYTNAPIVNGIAQVKLSGGSVTLQGMNLSNATVSVDGQAAVVAGSTATTLTFDVPAHAAGTVPIIVTNAGGSGNATLQYVAAPIIGSATITMLGTGTATTRISGQNLGNPTIVTINGQWAPVLQASDTSLLVSAPILQPGLYTVSVTTVGGTVTAPGSYSVTEPATLTLSATSVTAGSLVTATIRGFAPGAGLTFVLHSQAVNLGTAVAGPNGRATATLTIPADMEAGAHVLTATGMGGSGAALTVSADVTVTSGAASGNNDAGSLPFTGFDASTAATLATLVLVAGVLMLAASRRRRQRG